MFKWCDKGKLKLVKSKFIKPLVMAKDDHENFNNPTKC